MVRLVPEFFHCVMEISAKRSCKSEDYFKIRVSPQNVRFSIFKKLLKVKPALAARMRSNLGFFEASCAENLDCRGNIQKTLVGTRSPRSDPSRGPVVFFFVDPEISVLIRFQKCWGIFEKHFNRSRISPGVQISFTYMCSTYKWQSFVVAADRHI